MGDFCVCKVLEVVEETTFEVKRFCFPLQTLNSLLRVFFFSGLVIFCLMIFSQVISLYSNLG